MIPLIPIPIPIPIPMPVFFFSFSLTTSAVLTYVCCRLTPGLLELGVMGIAALLLLLLRCGGMAEDED